ncbi:hypothetical protein ACOZ4Y_04665 [Komagataeibacter rhaeticus]
MGVDGQNVTLNQGRFLINLKPADRRSSTAQEVATRLRAETADIAGADLYLQPVQDLSLDTSTSRPPSTSSCWKTPTSNQPVTTWVPQIH